MDFVRSIFGALDWGIYKIVEILLQTIVDLSNVEIFAESVIGEFASRIYVILGLVMLFKIMISFIQILIEPDTMNDKEKGVGNVLKRVVFSLILIFLVPSIFDLGRQVQNYVVPIIPKVVLGVSADFSNTQGSETLSSVGRTMAWYSFLPFFTYNNESCNQGQLLGIGTDNAANNTSGEIIATVGQAISAVNDKCPTSNDSRGYRYDYLFPFSTIVGLYLVYILVFVAIAIAIRAIKLGICEFIAPIPIASYIDPKTSKQAFDNWVSTSVKTYLDLFVRLIVVYFAIFVLDVVFDADNIAMIYAKIGGSFKRGTMITLFIILGLYQFVKDAPKFIMDMLGLKGGGDIASMFKGAGSLFASHVGAGIAGIGNVASGVRGAKNGKDILKALGSGVAGSTSGWWHGSRAALSGKGIKESFNSSTQTVWSRRNQRIADKASGSTLRGRLSVGVRDYFQFNDDVTLAEGTLKSMNDLHSGMGSHKQSVFKQIDKDDNIGFYGAHDGTSTTINAIGRLIKENLSTINSQGNADLHNLINGKFIENADGTWRLTKGANFGYADLKALESAADQSGIGSMAARLNAEGAIRLGAQKEIYEAANVGNVHTRSGSDYGAFLINPDFANPRQDMETNLKKNAGDFIGMKVDGYGIIQNAEEVIKAFNFNPKKFDDAVQARIRSVQHTVAENYDAVNRAANQRRKKQ